jgi:hypothetical protein
MKTYFLEDDDEEEYLEEGSESSDSQSSGDSESPDDMEKSDDLEKSDDSESPEDDDSESPDDDSGSSESDEEISEAFPWEELEGLVEQRTVAFKSNQDKEEEPVDFQLLLQIVDKACSDENEQEDIYHPPVDSITVSQLEKEACSFDGMNGLLSKNLKLNLLENPDESGFKLFSSLEYDLLSFACLDGEINTSVYLKLKKFNQFSTVKERSRVEILGYNISLFGSVMIGSTCYADITLDIYLLFPNLKFFGNNEYVELRSLILKALSRDEVSELQAEISSLKQNLKKHEWKMITQELNSLPLNHPLKPIYYLKKVGQKADIDEKMFDNLNEILNLEKTIHSNMDYRLRIWAKDTTNQDRKFCVLLNPSSAESLFSNCAILSQIIGIEYER